MLGIHFKPTDEFVSFKNAENKTVLFTNDENVVQQELQDMIRADSENVDNFEIQYLDTDSDGSEYCEGDTCFVSASIV